MAKDAKAEIAELKTRMATAEAEMKQHQAVRSTSEKKARELAKEIEDIKSKLLALAGV